MNPFESYDMSGIFGRLSSALKSGRVSDVGESVKELTSTLTERLQQEPMQTLAAGVACGFIFTKLLQTNREYLPKLIGQGIGSLVATRVSRGVMAEKNSKPEGILHH